MLIGTIAPKGPQGPGKLKVFINSVGLAAKNTVSYPREMSSNCGKIWISK